MSSTPSFVPPTLIGLFILLCIAAWTLGLHRASPIATTRTPAGKHDAAREDVDITYWIDELPLLSRRTLRTKGTGTLTLSSLRPRDFGERLKIAVKASSERTFYAEVRVESCRRMICKRMADRRYGPWILEVTLNDTRIAST